MSEFANLLRAWRDRVRPEEAGLPPGGARRTPGLRREELAMLAGISVDYVVRLEQGRAEHPSPQMLGALARALRLTDEERDHLYRVAGAEPPSHGVVPQHITPGVQRMLDRLADAPVAVYSAAWDVIQGNAMWTALLGDPTAYVGRDRNLVWRHFLQGPGPVRFSDAHAEEFAADLVADLRAAVGRYPADARIARLAAELREASPDFAARWAQARIAEHRSSRKVVTGTAAGDIEVDCDVLTVPGGDLRVVVYTAAPGSEDADKLALLRVLGASVPLPVVPLPVVE